MSSDLIRIKPKVPKFDINLKPKSAQTSDTEETISIKDKGRKMKRKIKSIHEEIDRQLGKIQCSISLL